MKGEYDRDKTAEKPSNKMVTFGNQVLEFKVKQINSTVNGVVQYSYVVESDQKPDPKSSADSDSQNQDCNSQDGGANIDINTDTKRKKPIFELPSEYNNWIFKDSDAQILPEQRLILDQQMRQHVQLITQCFLQAHGHPIFWNRGPQQKEYLVFIKYLWYYYEYSLAIILFLVCECR